MDKRRKSVDKDTVRQQRAELYEAIDRSELSIQETVKRMRTMSRLTQTEFAAHREVSAKVIKEVERGVANPTINTLNQIGRVFGLEVAFVRSEKLHAEVKSQSRLSADERLIMEQKSERILEMLQDFKDTFDEFKKK